MFSGIYPFRSTDIQMKIPIFYKPAIIGVLSILLQFFVPSKIQAQSWYNASWSYRKAITIDYTKVGTGPHTNFPVLISRADADLLVRAQADGDDILFTAANGTTKLSHEIESYTSPSGTIVAWVEIPSLSSSANTVIYMYYGNAAAASQQDVTGTWNTNFKGVYHLNNAFVDATSNSNNGTNARTYDMSGKISRIGVAKGMALYTPNTVRHFNLLLDNKAGVDFRTGKLRIAYTTQPDAKSIKMAETELMLSEPKEIIRG